MENRKRKRDDTEIVIETVTEIEIETVIAIASTATRVVTSPIRSTIGPDATDQAQRTAKVREAESIASIEEDTETPSQSQAQGHQESAPTDDTVTVVTTTKRRTPNLTRCCLKSPQTHQMRVPNRDFNQLSQLKNSNTLKIDSR